MKLPPNHFKCEICDGVFEQGWTEEEAKMEFKKRFPDHDVEAEDNAMVCEDCLHKVDFFMGKGLH